MSKKLVAAMITVDLKELEQGDLMALHVAIGMMQADLTRFDFREGVGEDLAKAYDMRLLRLSVKTRDALAELGEKYSEDE